MACPPGHDAAHQRTLSPNVIRNLEEVEEEEDVADVESQAFYANSPIVPKNFELSGDFEVVATESAV